MSKIQKCITKSTIIENYVNKLEVKTFWLKFGFEVSLPFLTFLNDLNAYTDKQKCLIYVVSIFSHANF